mgnify:CR=1 FL=1
MTTKQNKDKNFELETTLEYKNKDGSKGWIVEIKPKENSQQ